MTDTATDRTPVGDTDQPTTEPPPTTRLPVAGWSAIFAELRRLARGRRWQVIGVVLLFLVSAASGLVLPLTIGWIVDTVTAAAGSGVPNIFWWQLGALVGAALLGGAVEFLGIVALTRVTETMLAELRENYVATALRLPQQQVERAGIGDVVSRASIDIRRISDDLPNILPALAAAVFTLALATAGTVLIDWRFTIAFLLAIPLYLVALRWYLPAVPPVYAAESAAESARSEAVLTTINALPTVMAFRHEPDRMRRVKITTWELARWAMRSRIMQNRFFGRINLAEAIGMILVLSCGFLLAAGGGVTLGQVTAAGLLFLQISGPIAMLMFVMDDAQTAAASLARVIGVTDLGRTQIDVAGPADPATTADSPDAVVRLEEVTFGYRPDRPVVVGVDLTIGSDERVAIVGSTGSGKTTLAHLIAGTHQPDTGSIHRMVPIDRIVYLNQDTHVFAATVRDNLRLTAPDADDDMVLRALRSVGAESMVAALPEGLDTVVGHEGHRLTASDVQVLSLARMVLADPDLAILDEATSETDSQNTAMLDEATAQAIRDRSAIVIAHRLSQARMCDRILVLDRGRVVEQGSHSELLDAGGRYAVLWRAYSGTDRDAPPSGRASTDYAATDLQPQ